ncbi:7965_t:CDS:2, partial [Funneliformis geosporum]
MNNSKKIVKNIEDAKEAIEKIIKIKGKSEEELISKQALKNKIATILGSYDRIIASHTAAFEAGELQVMVNNNIENIINDSEELKNLVEGDLKTENKELKLEKGKIKADYNKLVDDNHREWTKLEKINKNNEINIGYLETELLITGEELEEAKSRIEELNTKSLIK